MTREELDTLTKLSDDGLKALIVCDTASLSDAKGLTREAFSAVGKMGDDELALLTLVNVASLSAILIQGNGTDAKVEALKQTHQDELAAKEQEKADIQTANQKALDDAAKAHQAATSQATTEYEQSRNVAKDKADADAAKLIADHKAATDTAKKASDDALAAKDAALAAKDTEKAQALSGANDIKQAEIASIELRAAADLTAKEAERSAAQIKADEAGAKATQLAADKAATDAANAKLLASLQSVAKTPEYLAKLQADKDAVIKQQQATDAAKAALVAEQAKIDAEIAANTKP